MPQACGPRQTFRCVYENITLEGKQSVPYSTLQDLPDSVRDNLPKHAQEIYRAAFNSAWDQYDRPEEASR
jgi:hypothetical protein